MPDSPPTETSLSSLVQRMVAGALRHWIALTTLSWLFSGALYLALPPGPDQFQHAYMGWRLLEGDAPYRDFIDMNWPGVMGLHAIATWAFGINVWSWRAFDFALFAAASAFLSDLVRLSAGREAGRIALALCPLIYVGASYQVPGQHDMSAAQFLVGALWFHVRGYEHKTWWYQVGTGMCIGAAMLNKPTLGVIGALLPLHALWSHAPIPRILNQTVVAGSAAVVTLIVAAGGILSRGTTWNELIDATYTFNVVSQFSGPPIPATDMALWFMQFHIRWYPMLSLGSIPALIWILARKRRSMAATSMIVLWAAGVLSYTVQWRGLGYHLAPSLLALAGIFPVSVAILAARGPFPGKSALNGRFATGVVALSLLWIVVKLGNSYYSLPMAVLTGDFRQHLARFHAGDQVNFADVLAFVHRLESLPPSECVLLVGTASSINYLSKRPEPTRFFHFPTLQVTQPPLPMAERWLDLWEADLQTAGCRFTLVPHWVSTDWLPSQARPATALRHFLQNYTQAGEIGTGGGIVVYERK